jgi:hypothetical protein
VARRVWRKEFGVCNGVLVELYVVVNKQETRLGFNGHAHLNPSAPGQLRRPAYSSSPFPVWLAQPLVHRILLLLWTPAASRPLSRRKFIHSLKSKLPRPRSKSLRSPRLSPPLLPPSSQTTKGWLQSPPPPARKRHHRHLSGFG